MGVWTISAPAGTGGEDVAARLAVAAGVPLLVRKTLALFAHALNPLVVDGEEFEARVGGPLNLAALSMAMTTGSVDASQEAATSPALAQLGLSGLDLPGARADSTVVSRLRRSSCKVPISSAAASAFGKRSSSCLSVSEIRFNH
jgi:hypothetical protein